MSKEFKDLVADARQIYAEMVAQSWSIVTSHTSPSDPAAIQAACELQRGLIVTGAEWLALAEQVLAGTAAPAASISEPTVSSDTATLQQPDVTPVARRDPRTAAAATGSVDATATPNAEREPDTVVVVPPEDAADEPPPAEAETVVVEPVTPAQPVPAYEADDEAAAPGASAAGASQTAQDATSTTIYPLVAGAATPHAQPVAIAFNDAPWTQVSAWRRVYQHVLQSLQRSDPRRFTELATTLTMSNGRLLFARDRSNYLAAIDAGGGWYTTGQMPTELILQRLRTLVDWWELPRETLAVQLAPTASPPGGSPAKRRKSGSDEATPVAPTETAAMTAAPSEDADGVAPATSIDATIADGDSVAEGQPVPEQNVAVASAPDVNLATPTTAADAMATETPSDEAALQTVEAQAVEPEPISQEVAVETNVEDAQVVDAADGVYTAERDQPGDGVRLEESAVSEESTADTGTPSAVVETVHKVDTAGAEVHAEQPGAVAETVVEEQEPVAVANSAPAASIVLPPTNGTAQPQVERPASRIPTVVADEPPVAAPTPPSNIRWVKTISGTRLPLRPPSDD